MSLSIMDTYFYKEYKCGTRVKVSAQSGDLDSMENDSRAHKEDGHWVLKLDKECNELYCEECN